MNILMGKSITAKYENCVEVRIQDMFDLANDNDLKDLTLKCKNEPDKTKRRNVKRTMPIFYPCIDTTQRENKVSNGVFQFDLDLEDNEETDFLTLRQQLEQQAYVLYVMQSPSGGLKFAVQTDFHEVVGQYTLTCKQAYKVAHRFLTKFVQKECGYFTNDPSVEKTSQSCFLAYDPEAFVNTNVAPYFFNEGQLRDISNTQLQPNLINDVPSQSNSQLAEQAKYLLGGVPKDLSYDDRLNINFTILHYFGHVGIQMLEQHWTVSDPVKLKKDLTSQLISGLGPFDNHLKSKSNFHIQATNTLSDYVSAQPAEIVYKKRQHIDDARKEIKDVVDTFFSEEKSIILKASCGLGKSTTIIEKLFRMPSTARVLIAVPNHSLASELNATFREKRNSYPMRQRGGHSNHLFGRSKSHTNPITGQIVHMCENTEVREAYKKLGLSIPQSECQKCLFKGDCNYINQFSNLESVRFTTHADLENEPSYWANGTYVTDGKNGDEYKVRKRGWTPDYIIIDENFIGRNNYEISMRTKFASLRTIVEAVTRGEDILQTLQKHKQQILNDCNKMKAISAKAAQSPALQSIKNDVKISNDERYFLDIFKKALKTKGNDTNLLSICPNRRNKSDSLIARPLSVIHSRFDGIPVLLLDATADETVLKCVLPDAEFLEISAAPNSNYKLSQCQNASFSKASFKKDPSLLPTLITDMTSKISKANPKKVGIISYKNLDLNGVKIEFSDYLAKQVSQDDPLVQVVNNHFGNIRGTNEFDDCDLLFIVGRYAIPEIVQLSIAKQVFPNNKINIEMSNVDCLARFNETESVILPNYTFISEEMQKINEAFSDADTKQAIYRLRCFSDKRRKSFLYSNRALGEDVSVNRFFDLPQEKLKALFENFATVGFCKIKKSELIKFGFSETQAREGRRDEIIRQLQIRGIRIFDVDYRKNGRMSSASYLVSDDSAFLKILNSSGRKVERYEEQF